MFKTNLILKLQILKIYFCQENQTKIYIKILHKYVHLWIIHIFVVQQVILSNIYNLMK